MKRSCSEPEEDDPQVSHQTGNGRSRSGGPRGYPATHRHKGGREGGRTAKIRLDSGLMVYPSGFSLSL